MIQNAGYDSLSRYETKRMAIANGTQYQRATYRIQIVRQTDVQPISTRT